MTMGTAQWLGVEDALRTLTPRIVDEIASLFMAGTGYI